jgi:hypothetical protein
MIRSWIAAPLLLALAGCSTADRSEAQASLGSAAASGAEDGQDDANEGDSSGAEDPEGSDEGGDALDLGQTPSCDPWAQDCPAASKCSWEQVAGEAKTRCVPIDPDPKQPGQPCTVFGDPDSGYDDCALGAQCELTDGDQQGVCVALCTGSLAAPSCAEPFAQCHACPDCPSLCWPLCDPLAQDCGPGLACTTYSGSFTCQPDDALGSGTFEDPCEYGFQCAPGHACLEAAIVPGCASSGCCTPFCSLAVPACPSPMTCTPWFDSNMAPLPDLGVCTAP